MKKLQIMAAGICAAGLMSLTLPAQASITTTYDNTIAPIVGSGNTSGAWTSANNSDLGLTLSLRAQDRFTGSGDLTPNDGAGTFTFPLAQQWDYWFDVNSGSLALSTYTYTLSFHSSLDPSVVTFGISSAYPSDNGISGNEFQNAEWLGFSGIDTTAIPATYYFTLDAKDGNGNVVDSVNMTVNSAVPEPTTIISGALLLLPFGAGAIRFLRKQRTV